ncbi:Aste57867_12225 [Aphanomyces stellatus]|uniref:Aste57867_12225 protein n=1 Tax=Aphanomyces stellatus TaxID=120398 RepID=A0A485KVF7_9STRA|nr:hypothetical protein As57867_012180 [Aphanomyces stellatus]VFT89079.1 Aste57867_12225 [Aphanomyces stellatus]
MTMLTKNNPWTNTKLPVIGVANTNSSTCQACHSAIPAGEIRVGIIFQHLNGYIGLDWHHLTCCETPEHLSQVDGYDLLGDAEKSVLQKYIKSCGA